MLKSNPLKTKLTAGLPVLGTWCVMPSPVSVDIIAGAGLDFAIIDNEHGPISFETAQTMAMAVESRGASPVMRVGGVIESEILRALDIGMHCVQVPNVETPEQAAEFVRFAKFPPAGNRGFSPFTRAGGYCRDHAKAHATESNANVMLAINVEGKGAVERIDDILKVEGIDIVFIGLFDLSKALGIPGDTQNPKVINLLRELSAKVTAAGKYPGTIATDADSMRQFLDWGLKYIVYLVDCQMLHAAYADVNRTFRELTS